MSLFQYNAQPYFHQNGIYSEWLGRADFQVFIVNLFRMVTLALSGSLDKEQLFSATSELVNLCAFSCKACGSFCIFNVHLFSFPTFASCTRGDKGSAIFDPRGRPTRLYILHFGRKQLSSTFLFPCALMYILHYRRTHLKSRISFSIRERAQSFFYSKPQGIILCMLLLNNS